VAWIWEIKSWKRRCAIKNDPYLFSTSAEQDAVVDAYSKSIQVFFIKPSRFQDLKV
jgi:hypothetical protein